MRIAFFETKPWEEDYLRSALVAGRIDADLSFSEGTLTHDTALEDTSAEVVSVFVNSTIDADVLESFPNLRAIVTRSTGFDHIALDAARARGIVVSNVPSYGENTVAEFAFALILALARRVHEAYARVRDEGRFSVEGLQGFDLRGKTIGVVGTGRIGRHAIAIAKGFGMNVRAFDAFPNEKLVAELGFSYGSLESVLAESDIVTLHVPYMKETHHLINGGNIRAMKKGAYLINTSRGAVVETEALVAALAEGHLGGAGLDVLEEEGPTKDELNFLIKGHPGEHNLKTMLHNHALIDMPNVIVTPHTAFNTKEALERILTTTADTITAFLVGKPVNVVTA